MGARLPGVGEKAQVYIAGSRRLSRLECCFLNGTGVLTARFGKQYLDSIDDVLWDWNLISWWAGMISSEMLTAGGDFLCVLFVLETSV